MEDEEERLAIQSFPGSEVINSFFFFFKQRWQGAEQAGGGSRTGTGLLPSSPAFSLLEQTDYSVLHFCSILLLKIQGICVYLGFSFVCFKYHLFRPL